MSQLIRLGSTPDGRPVYGGAFQLADTLGFPLASSLEQAAFTGCIISMPHYFASAMEHGWDDEQTFSRIKEALVDFGNPGVMDQIKQGCVAMFMKVAATMPDQPATEIGKRMRELLENNNTQRGLQLLDNPTPRPNPAIVPPP